MDNRLVGLLHHYSAGSPFYLVQLLRRFNGQCVAGNLFGIVEDDVLPCFTSVEPYMSPDGKIEMDAIGAGDSKWVVVVKWKGKSAGRKELKALAAKTTGMSVKLWYVAKSGFTTEAREYAADAGIMLSGEAELQQIAALVLYRLLIRRLQSAILKPEMRKILELEEKHFGKGRQEQIKSLCGVSFLSGN